MKINLNAWQLIMVALLAFACDSEDSKESSEQQGGIVAGAQGGIPSMDMLINDLDQKITVDMMGDASTDMQTAVLWGGS